MQTPQPAFRVGSTQKTRMIFMALLAQRLANVKLHFPGDYAAAIKNFDDQHYRQSLFVRHCRRLAQFLRSTHCRSEEQDVIDFAWLYDLADDRPPVVSSYVTHPTRAMNDIGNHNKLLFLSGYPSARLLLELGSQFSIDPAFFDTHLSFIKDDITSCSLHPSHYILPSRQHTVFQTSITSIGAAPEDLRYDNLTKKRAVFASKMEQYLHELRRGTNWKTFQSIVRAIEVHDARRFSLQQHVTILIDRPKDQHGKWLGTTHSPPLTLDIQHTDMYSRRMVRCGSGFDPKPSRTLARLPTGSN